MRTLYVLFVFLLILSTSACGQDEKSEKSDEIINKTTQNHTKFESTLDSFIIKRVLEDEVYVSHVESSKSYERKFTLWYCDEKEVVLMLSLSKDSTIQVTLNKGQVTDKESVKESSRKYSPFGKVKGSTVQTVISSIRFSIGDNEIELPSNVYSDIYSPNFCEVNLPVKQVEAYLSNDQKYVYLYIFGEVKYEKETAFYEGFRNSYLAKIILTTDGNHVTTIALPGRILELYNWISNPLEFRGF